MYYQNQPESINPKLAKETRKYSKDDLRAMYDKCSQNPLWFDSFA